MVTSLPPFLALFLVTMAHVVATWVGQLKLSLQAFAHAVPSAQSGVMNILILP